jgi:hypothetical protein
MKKHFLTASSTMLAGLLLAAGLSILNNSCQTPTQPDPSAIPVTRTVYVRDGNGNNFPNATVQVTPATAQNQMASATTGPNGGVVFTADVPPGVQWYIFTISAASYPAIQDSVLLGCNDTTLEFTLVKQLSIQCTTIAEQDSAKCHVCIGSSATDSALTPWLSFSCPNALNVTATNAGATQLMSVTYYTKTPVSAPSATPPATLQPGQQLQAKVVYKPTVVSNPTDVFTLTLSFTAPGTTITYAYKVTGTAENCASCICPPTDFIDSLPKPDTVCVNSTGDTSITLSSVHNPGNCPWLFTLQSDFPDNSEIVLSTRSFTLAGGSSLSTIGIAFSPQQNKVYDETATFSISTEPPNGTGTACSEVLKIHFVGYGSGPSCSVDAADLLTTTTINATKYNFQTCVAQSDMKTLEVINTGACPVQNISLAFQNASGTLWQVSPALISSIPPGDSIGVVVTFSPSSTDVFGTGDPCIPNPLTTTFLNTLTVNGCGNMPLNYPLTGYGDPNCHPSAEFDLPDYTIKNEGVQIDSGTNAIHTQPQGDTTTWFLYVTNLVASTGAVGSGSVTLHGGIIPAGVPGLKPGHLCLFSPTAVGQATSASGDACSIGCQYKGQCDLSMTGPSSVVAHSGDVFLFTYWTDGQASGLPPLCGIIHVGDIHTDLNLGYTVADLDICFPIY